MKEVGIIKALIIFHIGILILSICILLSIFVARYAALATPLGLFLMFKGYRMGKG